MRLPLLKSLESSVTSRIVISMLDKSTGQRATRHKLRTKVLRLGVAVVCQFHSLAQSISIPPDSPRWQLDGKAKAIDYLGRRCLSLAVDLEYPKIELEH